MTAKVSKESKCRRCSQGLARFLKKVKDFYVKSMTELANQIDSGCGPAAVNVSTLPVSFSMNSRILSSSDQDLAELMRIASRRGLVKKVETEFLSQQWSTSGGGQMNVVPHSRSLGMGRIDEDKACDFDGIDGFDLNSFNFPRSRSHVVSTRTQEVMGCLR